jgi:GntR family hexuronate regulon transcriptional repressor
MHDGPQDNQKLYQQIAGKIAAAIAEGRYRSGDKLPSERELADELGVSRPTIRDALLTLEFQGLVEARQGAGVHVSTAASAAEEGADTQVSALEFAEARRLFEGEACALSAAIVTDEQLARLDRLVEEMADGVAIEEIERLEQEFSLTLARATSNAAIVAGMEDLWTLRRQSPPCAATLRRARVVGTPDFTGQHRQIVAALRTRDPQAARRAIHGHVGQIMDVLLMLAESDALEQIRQKMAEQRRALARRTEI